MIPAPQPGAVTDADLLAMPSDWRFCAVGRNKQPIDGDGWGLRCVDRDADYYLQLNGTRPPALGLLLNATTGTLAIDRDASGWDVAFRELTGRDISDLPRTIAWTSGKPGRQQQAFTVPLDWQPLIEGRKLHNTAGQVALEVRWGGAAGSQVQSVVCGFHPETGAYRWVEGCSPHELGDPAEAPEWLLEAIVRPAYDDTEQPPPTEAHAIEAAAILRLLPPEKFQSYDPWLKVGMALHHVGVDIGHWIEWSRSMPSFDEKECRLKWKSFAKYKGRRIGLGSMRRWGIPYGHTPPAPPPLGAAPTTLLDAATRHLAIALHLQELNAGRGDIDPARSFLLTDAPGAGKTHLVEPLARTLIATDQVSLVIYCSPDYRSPSIPVLKTWAEVKSRHNGIEEYTINGTRKRRRRKADSTLKVVENPSCLISRKLGVLRAQGLSSEQESQICQRCDFRPACNYVEDHKRFVADLQRKRTTRIRCSISSLPAIRAWAGDETWRKTVVLIDEAPQLLAACARTSEISYDTLKLWAYAIQHSDAYDNAELLLDLLDRLIALPAAFAHLDAVSEGRTNFTRFGFDFQQLAEHLLPWQQGLPPAGLPHSWLAEQTPSIDLDHPDPVIPELLLLPALLHAVTRTDGATLHATPDALALTLPALPAIHEALDASAGNVILDGTSHLQDVQHWLAPSHPADVTAACTTEHNGIDRLAFFQVTGAGAFGSSRRPAANEHRDRIINAIHHLVGDPAAVGTIDFAKHVREGWGSWFNASRGTNAFADCRALILVGRPHISWAAGMAQFAVAHRGDPEAQDALSGAYGAWYARRRGEEIVQAIHRLRPGRRAPGREPAVFLLSDGDIGDIGRPVVRLPAHAISWAAGSPAHQLLHEAARVIRARGGTTQRDAAQALIAAGSLGIKPDAKPLSVERRLQRACQELGETWEDLARHALAFAGTCPEQSPTPASYP
jgi:hypothetical protein